MVRTEDAEYSRCLRQRSTTWWKRLLPVQYPYRRLAQQVFPVGKVLDVGCGYGRLLSALPTGSVGVDHNAALVATARASGLDACLPEQFRERFDLRAPVFDGLVCAHVVEHMDRESAIGMLRSYLPSVKPGSPCMIVTPQARGFAADPTHVQHYGMRDLESLAEELGLRVTSCLSYPFPRIAGRVFPYNENVLLAVTPASA